MKPRCTSIFLLTFLKVKTLDVPVYAYLLFLKLKQVLKRPNHIIIEETKNTANMWFEMRSNIFFTEGLRPWTHHLGKCIDQDSNYNKKINLG